MLPRLRRASMAVAAPGRGSKHKISRTNTEHHALQGKEERGGSGLASDLSLLKGGAPCDWPRRSVSVKAAALKILVMGGGVPRPANQTGKAKDRRWRLASNVFVVLFWLGLAGGNVTSN